MKAAVLAGPRSITVKEVPAPEVGAGQIGIDVSACGVCGSDIHMWKAGKGWGKGETPDFTMGHEFCGVVTDPGESKFQKGDRVVFWANLYCGECDMCRAGQEHLCRAVDGTNYIGFVCNGAYAEKFAGPAKNAYLLPDSVSDVAAGLIDPLMVAYHAVRKSGIKLGDKVLVAGTGIIGLMIGELAKKAGASYVALEKRSDRKIAVAKKAGYFDEYFDSREPDMLRHIVRGRRSGEHSRPLHPCLEARRHSRHDRQQHDGDYTGQYQPRRAPGDKPRGQRILHAHGIRRHDRPHREQGHRP